MYLVSFTESYNRSWLFRVHFIFLFIRVPFHILSFLCTSVHVISSRILVLSCLCVCISRSCIQFQFISFSCLSIEYTKYERTRHKITLHEWFTTCQCANRATNIMLFLRTPNMYKNIKIKRVLYMERKGKAYLSQAQPRNLFLITYDFSMPVMTMSQRHLVVIDDTTVGSSSEVELNCSTTNSGANRIKWMKIPNNVVVFTLGSNLVEEKTRIGKEKKWR